MTRPSALGSLSVYLLGTVDFDEALRLQHALAYQVSGDRASGALVLCEHPPLLTVGRHGAPGQLGRDPLELRAHGWPVRWVNRGGGCWLHLPGQLAIYPILCLDHLGLGLSAYLDTLQDLLRRLLADFGILANLDLGRPGLQVGGRLLADIGFAVRDWVSYYGAVLNVHADLTATRAVLGTAQTSLERERRGPLRPALVRERLLEVVTATFPFERTHLFFGHPLLERSTSTSPVTRRA
jgi:lipoyl(octanoyl) transferase